MLGFILDLFRGERRGENGEKVRRWTEQEPERIRTFEEHTQTSASGGFSLSISYTQEMATSRQIEFLRKLGFPSDGLTKGEATELLDRILRPVDYALSQTFKNWPLTLDKEHLRAIQVTMVHWDYYRQLPRYGPHSTWKELEASGNHPHRKFTQEEKIAVTDIALRLLPPQMFVSLKSNGIKKYKDRLDERLRAGT